MHILLTNDDGIFAPGLRALAEALRGAGHRVSVCAPDRERSAASHSVTLGANAGLRAEPCALDWAERAWAADGTPADCASLGLWLTGADAPADMVIAGINRGMNQGGACVYSGTVAAAMEAAMCGVQALAVSLCVPPHGIGEIDYSTAARVAVRVAEWMPAHPLPMGVIYNLNVPPIPYEALRGIAPATLAPVFLDPPEYEQTADGRWRYKSRYREYQGDDYDITKTGQGFASLTKLTWDFRLNADDAELGQIGL